VLKKISNGASYILSLLEALKPTTADINSQILITPPNTFITNITGRILFLINTFLLSMMNSFVLMA